MTHCFSSALALFVAASAVGASAQQPHAPRFPAETSAVVLDVVVRDRHGHMVRDLEASEFRVFENGVEQAVDGFVVMALGQKPGRTAGRATPSPAGPVAPPAPTKTRASRRDAQPTLVVLVFDRLSPAGRSFARKAALAFAQDVFRPGDVVGVFTTDLALRAVGPFTAERGQLVSSIERATQMAWTGGDASLARARVRDRQDKLAETSVLLRRATADTPSSGQTIGQIASSQTVERMAIRLAQTSEDLEREQQGHAATRSLQGLIEALSEVRGRKTVLLFSEGLAIPAAVRHSFRRVIDAANKANVSFYAVDAAGLRAESSVHEAREELERLISAREQIFAAGDFEGSRNRRFERAEDRMRLAAEATLGPLAQETGGFLMADGNDVSDRLREMGEDMRFYYVLTYRPANQDYDGRFRKLKVKVRRKGLDVRTRRGYLAIPSATHDQRSALR